MYNCELFNVLTNEADAAEFDRYYSNIFNTLVNKGINIADQSVIAPNPNKISAVLTVGMETGSSTNLYLFANAIESGDSESFKKLFFEFISRCESTLKKDDTPKGKIAKIKIHAIKGLGNCKGYCFRFHERLYIALPPASKCGVSPDELISLALDKAQVIFAEADLAIPAGISFLDAAEAKKNGIKKEGFFASFIPRKTDPPKTKAKKWAVLIAILAFLIALGYVLWFFVIGPLRNNAINSEIREIAHNSQSEDGEKKSAQDWDALKKINPEIVGWITNPGTKIDYPVLEHKGDSSSSQFYLYHDYKKRPDNYGSIFVDYRCKDSVNSRNVILHGHNMIDGSMFHSLVDYSKDLEGNLEYYKKHPVMDFNTPEGDSKWKIISVFKTSTLYEHGYFFNYMQGEFTSDAEFMNFVYNCRVRSLFNIPVACNENDQILTLSTCSYEFTYWRTVVVLRKVREGESEKVNVKLATKNKKPLFPEVYYSRYGGTRPKELTFKTANKKGLVSWYDGKGNLKGDETLTATVAANPTEPPTEKMKKKKKATTETQPEEVTFYTVTFLNWDGSEYETHSVREGDSISVPKKPPKKPDDEHFTYTFTGWDLEGFDLDSVHYSMSIAPQYKWKRKK